MDKEIQFTSETLKDILSKEMLHIPSYQRPYKWNRKHIRNLFYDVREVMQSQKESYQIGALILHENGDTLDIVDGQQRLISISLLLHVLGKEAAYAGAKKLLHAEYDEVSCYNASENAKEWQNLTELTSEKETEGICDFLLHHCTVSVITMPKDRLAEAFQLFDSQNNRGKSLAPHDLLKAYHLRTIEDASENDVEHWERMVDDSSLNLQELFDKHLFRMRLWSRGQTGLTKKRYGSYLRFTEDFIDEFKGVDLSDSNQKYPYLDLYRNMGDFKSVTMPIIDGQYFFDYVKDAQEKVMVAQRYIVEEIIKNENDFDSGMIDILKSPKGRYVRCLNLFVNLLSLFINRFGEEALSREVVDIIFVWSYYPRIKARAIYDATLGKYAAGKGFRQKEVQNLFQLLENARTPQDFMMKIDTDLFENMTVSDIVKEENKK